MFFHAALHTTPLRFGLEQIPIAQDARVPMGLVRPLAKALQLHICRFIGPASSPLWAAMRAQPLARTLSVWVQNGNNASYTPAVVPTPPLPTLVRLNHNGSHFAIRCGFAVLSQTATDSTAMYAAQNTCSPPTDMRRSQEPY